MNLESLIKELDLINTSLSGINKRLASICSDDSDTLSILKNASDWFNKISISIEWDKLGEETTRFLTDWEEARKQIDASKLYVALRKVKTSLDKLIEKVSEVKAKEEDIKSGKT